jgi:hypothetical protein
MANSKAGCRSGFTAGWIGCHACVCSAELGPWGARFSQWLARAGPPARRTALPPTAAGPGAGRIGGAGGCVLPVRVHLAAEALPSRAASADRVLSPLCGAIQQQASRCAAYQIKPYSQDLRSLREVSIPRYIKPRTLKVVLLSTWVRFV